MIALLRDGDTIHIDIPGRRIDAALSREEVERRRTTLKPYTPRVTSGYLRRYAQSVQNAGTGAILA
jgi:dihydroxy-acid dehydratase